MDKQEATVEYGRALKLGQKEAKELQQCINRFLATLPRREREIFLLRYFHVKSMDDIARQYRLSQSGVRTVLMRTRRKLKDHLKKEEYLHE